MAAEFHDKEISDFIKTTTEESLSSQNPRSRFTEAFTPENISVCTNAVRRKLRDYLEQKSIPCRKGYGDSILHRLKLLLSPHGEPAPAPSPNASSNSFTVSSAKRDILKVPRNKDDLYGAPYSGSILSSVIRVFLQDCLSFEISEK